VTRVCTRLPADFVFLGNVMVMASGNDGLDIDSLVAGKAWVLHGHVDVRIRAYVFSTFGACSWVQGTNWEFSSGGNKPKICWTWK